VTDVPGGGVRLGAPGGGFVEFDANGVPVRDLEFTALDSGFEVRDAEAGSVRTYDSGGALVSLQIVTDGFTAEFTADLGDGPSGQVVDESGNTLLRVDAVEFAVDGGTALFDGRTGAAIRFDADGSLAGQTLVGVDRGGEAAVFKVDYLGETATRLGKTDIYQVVPEEDGVRLVNPVDGDSVLYDYNGTLLGESVTVSGLADASAGVQIDHLQGAARLDAPGLTEHVFAFAPRTGGGFTLTVGDDVLEFGADSTLVSAELRIPGAWFGTALTVGVRSAPSGNYGIDLMDSGGAPTEGFSLSHADGTVSITELDGPFAGAVHVFGPFLGDLLPLSQQVDVEESVREHPREGLGQLRLDMPGGSQQVDAADQQALEAVFPTAAGGFAVHPPVGAAWVGLVNTAGGFGRDEFRAGNCIDVSLSFEESWRGKPTVAAALFPQYDKDGRPVLRFEDRLKRELYAGKRVDYEGRGSAGLKSVARKLLDLGPGSSAVVGVTWESGGGHAFNAVNDAGAVVWVDAQSVRITDQPRQDVDAVRSLVFDAQGRPVFYRPQSFGPQTGGVDETDLAEDLERLTLEDAQAVSGDLAGGLRLVVTGAEGSQSALVLDGNDGGAVVFRGAVTDVPGGGVRLDAPGGGFVEFDADGVPVRDWEFSALDGGGFEVRDEEAGSIRRYDSDGSLVSLRIVSGGFTAEFTADLGGRPVGLVIDVLKNTLQRVDSVEFAEDGGTALYDGDSGAAMRFDVDGVLVGQTLVGLDRGGDVAVFEVDYVGGTATREDEIGVYQAVPEEKGLRLVDPVGGDSVLYDYDGTLLGESVTVSGLADASVLLEIDHRARTARLDAAGVADDVFAFVPGEEGGFTLTRGDDALEFGADGTLVSAELHIRTAWFGAALTVGVRSAPAGNYGIDLMDSQGAPAEGFSLSLSGGTVSITELGGRFAGTAYVFGPFLGYPLPSSQQVDVEESAREHSREGLGQLRFNMRGGTQRVKAADQQALEAVFPSTAGGFAVHPPVDAAWVGLINTAGGFRNEPFRTGNCIDVSLSFEESWRGNPTVAAALFPAYDRHRRPFLRHEHRLKRELYAGKRSDYEGRGSAGLKSVAHKLRDLGAGASAVVGVTWKRGGGHAFNAVNDAGAVVWVDAQLVRITDRPRKGIDTVTSLVFDPQGRPVFYRPQALSVQAGGVDETELAQGLDRLNLEEVQAVSRDLAGGLRLLVSGAPGAQSGSVFDANGSLAYQGTVTDLPNGVRLTAQGGGFQEYDGDGFLVREGLPGAHGVVLDHLSGTAQLSGAQRTWEFRVDGAVVRLLDRGTGNVRVYRPDGALVGRQLAGRDRDGNAVVFSIDHVQGTATSADGRTYRATPRGRAVVLVGLGNTESLLYSDEGVLLGEKYLVAGFAGTGVQLEVDHSTNMALLHAPGWVGDRFTYARQPGGRTTITNASATFEFGTDNTLHKAVYRVHESFLGVALTVSAEASSQGGYLFELRDAQGVTPQGFTVAAVGGRLIVRQVAGRFSGSAVVFDQFFGLPVAVSQQIDAAETALEHDRENINQVRSYGPGGIQRIKPMDQLALQGVFPKTGAEFTVNPPPDHAWVDLINTRDGYRRDPFRTANCGDAALAVEESWRGRPTVAGALHKQYDRDGRPILGGESLSKRERYAGKRSDFEPLGPAGLASVAAKLRALGPGASAFVSVWWADGSGSHVFNAVNDRGAVRWIDGQNAAILDQPHQNVNIVRSVVFGPQGRPVFYRPVAQGPAPQSQGMASMASAQSADVLPGDTSDDRSV
jgi:hypothetical protein